jgi:hypothetical protein
MIVEPMMASAKAAHAAKGPAAGSTRIGVLLELVWMGRCACPKHLEWLGAIYKTVGRNSEAYCAGDGGLRFANPPYTSARLASALPLQHPGGRKPRASFCTNYICRYNFDYRFPSMIRALATA